MLGDREIRICRELTKVHESVLAVTISEAISMYEAEEPKGEMVVVIKGRDEEEIAQAERSSWEEMSVKDHVTHYMQQGLSEKDAMKQAAKDRGLSKRDIYDEIKK